MKLIDLFNQSSQAIQTSESLLQEYDEFSRMYTIDNNEYFEDRLTKMGYTSDDVSSIMINKDLLLSLFLNKFDVIEIDDCDTKIEIDLEIEAARKKYIDAVDNANEAIKSADEAKTIMLSTKDIIEKESGINPNKWTNKNVRSLNKAIAIYNELVEKANSAVDLVGIFRKELASVRIKKSNIAVDSITETNNVVYETS
jgi:hypothetical protein